MPEILERRCLKNLKHLDRILNSTRKYYGIFSDKYVEFYDNWLRGKEAFSNTKYKRGYDKVKKILTGLTSEPQIIIDVGCGIGNWSVIMAKNGTKVVGLDYAIEALSEHRKKSKDENVESNISRILGDGFNIPFRNCIFDGGTLNWVLAHIPVRRGRKFMKEVGRVFKGNSWLMISDSYWRGQEGRKEQFQIRKTDKGNFEVYKYYYTPEEIQNLLETTFGEVVHIETTGLEMLCVARKYET